MPGLVLLSNNRLSCVTVMLTDRQTHVCHHGLKFVTPELFIVKRVGDLQGNYWSGRGPHSRPSGPACAGPGAGSSVA